MSRLLLVEDDPSLGATLKERLGLEGHDVTWSQSVEAAKELISGEKFELAILDVGLPDGSGFDLAKELRVISSIPFIFMTAASDAENRLQGFELGAEEFIPKPFHLKELLIRVKHVLDNHVSEAEINLLEQKIDFSSMCLIKKSGEKVTLGQKENQILKILVGVAPAVVSREHILNEVWGADKFPSNRTVDNIIVKLRQLLGNEDGRWIRSVRGVGYQWISPEEVNDG